MPQNRAPRRLTPALPGVFRTPVDERPLDLVRGESIQATPLIAWRSGNLHVTAVRLRNRGASSVILDPRSLRGENPAQAMGLLEQVGLGHAARRRIGTYSKGMRQRVGLAQTLIGTPRLLVLDEPTSGLDPVSRRDFYELLDGLAARGASILLSSHALTEVEARTDRILILSKGRMVAEGSLAALRRQAALPVALSVTPAPGQAAALAQALPGAVAQGDLLTLSVAQGDKLAALARIAGLGGQVADLDVLPPSLEDIYSHFSRRDGQ